MSHSPTHIDKTYGGKIRVRINGICIQNEQILLVKHVNIGEKNYFWNPPGGGLEYGESIEECLKREFFEETGIKIRVLEFLFVNEFIHSPLHAVELNFLVEAIGGNLRVGKDPEHTEEEQLIREVRFVDINALETFEEKTLNPYLEACKRKKDIINLRGLLKF